MKIGKHSYEFDDMEQFKAFHKAVEDAKRYYKRSSLLSSIAIGLLIGSNILQAIIIICK